MSKPNISMKDALGKLGFLKNNLALLVPIIIAVAALLLFIPTRILRGKLQETIRQESVRMGGQIDNLIQDVNKASEAEAFDIDRYAKDVNDIELLAKQTTLRELLSYKLFPDTNELSPLLFEEFGSKYVAGIEAMLTDMGAQGPPADAEIGAALRNAPRATYQRGGAYGGYSPGPSPMMPTVSGYGQRRAFRITSEMDLKILDKVCADRARAAKVYANFIDMDGYTYWSEWKFEDRDKAYRDCWYWQLGYWIIEDVAATVREMNMDAENILNAPVKRLMNVSFVLRSRMAGMRRRRVGIRRNKDVQSPAYVTSARDAMTKSCTGRFTNEEIDVVHFNARAVVRADDVMPFMQKLCRAKEHKFRGFFGDLPERRYEHNQITVLESNIAPVNRQSYEHDLYRYGDDAVVELDLICEYIFQKAAYEDIKPQLVKDDIVEAATAKQPGQRLR
jgi:hypothetical protein